ncbi:MAG: HAD-IC family P-type ATPase [Bacteriovorax sp.]|nr:HAD-IC family P-type ATPase [Bacteriovorax sp.]
MDIISWHTLNSDEALFKLESNTSAGLTHAEAKKRLKQYGKNTLPGPKRRSYASIFIHQFLSPLIYLLLAASIFAFFLGEGSDAIVIIVVVLLNAIIGTFQEGRAEFSLFTLRQLSKLKTRILRDGQEQIIEASEIVPGDILILNAGDAVPADARLLETALLSISEAALTGESLPVTKSNIILVEDTLLADRKNMVYSGTHIATGRGLALVTATGMNNEMGKITNLVTNTVEPKTSLEVRIAQLGRYLVIISIIVFLLVIAIGLIQGISFNQIFMIAISQMVSLVPEGLPVAITISLAIGVQRMAKRGTIVRRLAAVESLGSTNIICTDKTGTLTKNEMTVTALYFPIGNRKISVTGIGYEPNGEFIENEKNILPSNDKALNKLFIACTLCNDAQLIEPSNSDNKWKIIGDPTEGALLTLVTKGGMNNLEIRNKFQRIKELPFNSENKMMATQHKIDGTNIVFIKGAPETIINLCESIYNDDHVIPFEEISRQEIQNVVKEMAELSLRTLAFGFIQNFDLDDSNNFNQLDKKISFIGLIGELDPPRAEVASSIQECKAAGIRTVMITGDHKATGQSIARSLGITQNNDLAIDGLELDQLNDQELMDKIDHINVFARVQPIQKLRIVDILQKKGNIVAMTGDGVNDAPALIRANIGIAMGITGTEIAKEAAKIIITDDNFSTIVAAIAEGRLVYQNIKKLILFLIVTSLDEVLILFLALILGYSPPFAAVQILWINLIAEGTLTINLIMEPLDGDEMNRAPIPINLPLLDRALLSRIPLMLLSSVTSTFGWFVYRSAVGISSSLVQSETFTLLVICQWFNVLNCRSEIRSVFSRDLFKNPWLLGALVLSSILHAAVIYWPPLSKFFHTVPIELSQLFLIIAAASLVLWTEEIRKMIARKNCS